MCDMLKNNCEYQMHQNLVYGKIPWLEKQTEYQRNIHEDEVQSSHHCFIHVIIQLYGGSSSTRSSILADAWHFSTWYCRTWYWRTCYWSTRVGWCCSIWWCTRYWRMWYWGTGIGYCSSVWWSARYWRPWCATFLCTWYLSRHGRWVLRWRSTRYCSNRYWSWWHSILIVTTR